MRWLWRHKALLSYPVGFAAAGLAAKGNTQAAAIVGMAATWLNGGGHAKSDSYYEDHK